MAETAASNGADPAVKKNESIDDRKLFVGGLSWETKEEHLKEYFGKFGTLEKVELKLDPMTGRSRGFAFIVFEDAEPVPKVMEAGEHAINSKKVDVKKAKGRTGKLFVGGLKPEMSDDDIKAAFSQYGNIVDFEMPMDKSKGQRKGFGFITFEKEDTMKELLKVGSVEIGEHKVDLRKAAPKQQQQQHFGGGGYGYGNQGGYMDYYGYGGYDAYGYGGWGGGGYAGYYGGGGGGKMTRPKGRGGARGGAGGAAAGGAAAASSGAGGGGPY